MGPGCRSIIMATKPYWPLHLNIRNHNNNFSQRFALKSTTQQQKEGINSLKREEEAPPEEPTTKDCPYCYSEIPIKATRCGFCTSEL
jgi:hypothetical protein